MRKDNVKTAGIWLREFYFAFLAASGVVRISSAHRRSRFINLSACATVSVLCYDTVLSYILSGHIYEMTILE